MAGTPTLPTNREGSGTHPETETDTKRTPTSVIARRASRARE
jgi:hypothetical protein